MVPPPRPRHRLYCNNLQVAAAADAVKEVELLRMQLEESAKAYQMQVAQNNALLQEVQSRQEEYDDQLKAETTAMAQTVTQVRASEAKLRQQVEDLQSALAVCLSASWRSKRWRPAALSHRDGPDGVQGLPLGIRVVFPGNSITARNSAANRLCS